MPPSPKTILCVCLGNICRSPTAEAVLRQHLPDAEIQSAGTAGWHAGKSPYGPAIAAAAGRGYRMDGLRARQVRRKDFARFDLILAMDGQNMADLRAMAPATGGARLAMFLEPLGGGDVPDPYYTRDFEAALGLIEEAAAQWGRLLA